LAERQGFPNPLKGPGETRGYRTSGGLTYLVVWEKIGSDWKLAADIWNDGK
jgi:hypothetical protein